MKEPISMKLANRLKNLEQKTMITFLSYLVLLMKENPESILAILTKGKSGLKMKRETFSLSMQMEIVLRKCQCLSIWTRW